MFQPSKHQVAISQHTIGCSQRPQNLRVVATPGSGKSRTLQYLCEELQAAYRDVRVDVVAFNDRVAKKAAREFPSCATAITLHSAGKRALENYMGRRYKMADQMSADDGELAPYKTARIVAKLKEAGYIDRFANSKQVVRLVAAAKAVGLGPHNVTVGLTSPSEFTPTVQDTDDAWWDLIRYHQIQSSQPGILIAAARAALRRSIESGTAIIDFADMIYLPAHMPAVLFPTKHFVMVDELQDLDAVQRRLVKKMLGECPKCGRVGAAGSPPMRRQIGRAHV